ncbi:LOW QUALITY PROTEIN: solute carrier family 15 member 1-like [Limulus polyphemus]|uniref:LOW QUALITY PROTEIN: solute carrier family 15 member 1-like n=1 Tax=Limulus polyphemus TaxID=6850 RepID=A0ABM1SK70_LIMPO|nr:LOW QUALITY PROTEIN: solute carrier family 15 member 1-like [Limulus polyphemus]
MSSEKKKDETSKSSTNLVDNEAGTQKLSYPKSIFFIIGNEFCERFSYYGMKAVLTLYLTLVLLYDDDTATMIYHIFSMGCYFTPIFGAMLADSLLGKFRTIFYISILYAGGNIVLALASIPNFLPMIPISMTGLALIAIGTGGIKPCVSAFGGDQFGPGQERQLQRFFSLFYLSINAGSLLSTFLTPILRADIHCFGNETCYPLAFGVPAVLMVIAVVLFLLGKSLYKIVPPKGNIVITVMKCICHALGRKSSAKKNGEHREHWLEYADDKYDRKLIGDIKDVLHVLKLYLPLPVFWALFDQQGSRWTLQATRMDGELGGFLIKPDQMQVINPLLIIAFIPLFEYIIYPVTAKCNFLTRPLQRIAVGGLLTASSFVIAGFLQLRIESTLPVTPASGFAQFGVINTLPCELDLAILSSNVTMKQMSSIFLKMCKLVAQNLTFTTDSCLKISEKKEYTINLTSQQIQTLLVTSDNENIIFHKMEETLKKPEKGEVNIRIVFTLRQKLKEPPVMNSTFKIVGKEKEYYLPLNFEKTSPTDVIIGSTDYERIIPGVYSLYIPAANDSLEEKFFHEDEEIGTFEVRNGGGYLVTIAPGNGTEGLEIQLHTIVQPNEISMFLQIPQYLVITMGEIMFSITGLEFSYSQAPVSMKSVLQAAWLLTVAFGNLIVVIIAKLHLFNKQSLEFFMFACLMAADMVIFAIMGYFYKYVNQDQEEKEAIELSQKNRKPVSNGVRNEGCEDDTHI